MHRALPEHCAKWSRRELWFPGLRCKAPSPIGSDDRMESLPRPGGAAEQVRLDTKAARSCGRDLRAVGGNAHDGKPAVVRAVRLEAEQAVDAGKT
jgi:hypothetical protein